MKTKSILLAVIVSVLIISYNACKKDDSATNATTNYLDLPAVPYHYDMGISTDEIITLGRVLFYDKHLSVNNSISCGSCHKQAAAFSDISASSTGFESRITSRNTPPIQNLGFGAFSMPPSLFWDGREKFLLNMVLKPILNHVEMGMNDMEAIVTRVKALPYYKDLFVSAFGSDEVTINKIANALSSFTGSISSVNTKFDMSRFGQTTLNGLEAYGKSLFFSKYDCSSCHQEEFTNPYQVGGGFVNIGLDVNYKDNGVGALTGNPADNGKFKIPDLRNVALTAPYMHDGRFATLDQVLEHYSHGIADHPNLDQRLRAASGSPKRMNITAEEKTALIAFLNTLTDFRSVTDVRFSDPFRIK